MSVFLQPIYTQTVGSGGASSITFNNIPQTFTDIMVMSSVRRDISTGSGALLLRLNGATTGYSHTRLQGQGSGSAVSDRATTDNEINAGEVGNSTNTANTFMLNTAYIPNYTTSIFKAIVIDGVSENNTTGAFQNLIAGLWSNSAAVTSLTLLPAAGNFVQYSTISLYGVLRQGI